MQRALTCLPHTQVRGRIRGKALSLWLSVSCSCSSLSPLLLPPKPVNSGCISPIHTLPTNTQSLSTTHAHTGTHTHFFQTELTNATANFGFMRQSRCRPSKLKLQLFTPSFFTLVKCSFKSHLHVLLLQILISKENPFLALVVHFDPCVSCLMKQG